jgi:hypothetical protein
MIIRGTLRSIDGKLTRSCEISVKDSNHSISDRDDWPDGDVYEVQFEGGKEWHPLTRKGGHYVVRRGPRP